MTCTFPIGGCNGGAQEEPPPADEAFCEAVCDRLSGCGPVVGCEARCEEDNVHLASLRPDLGAPLARCVEGLTCEEASGLITDCFEIAASVIPMTDRGKEYCEDFGEYSFRCSWYVSESECRSWYGGWKDDVLESFSTCFNASCDDFGACAGAVIEELSQ